MYRGTRVLLIVMVFALMGMIGCDGGAERERFRHRMILAVTPWPGSAAIYVAGEKGYFQEEGIEAVFRTYPSGHLGLEAMFSEKANLATAGDTPIARAALEGHPVTVAATLCEINRAVLLVARKDKGISSLEDLKGKRIGVVAGTTADFFLHIFLTTSYIRLTDVRIIDLETEKVVDALGKGEVDAVCTWSPYTTIARERLGRNAVIFDDPTIYKMTWNLATTKGFAERNPESIRRLLRVMLKAKKFILAHPDETRAIIAKTMGTQKFFLEQEWDDYTFTVSLDHSLIVNLEDQARWMLRQGRGEIREPFNGMDFIYIDGLQAVQPEALGIHDI
ncbi:MAG: ABC transporter substrate-binding protein [Deltaproteobacteria bacterium]|nr:ABC transporter substrate-binding protein [Deltaproteobacteria bacterium]